METTRITDGGDTLVIVTTNSGIVGISVNDGPVVVLSKRRVNHLLRVLANATARWED